MTEIRPAKSGFLPQRCHNSVYRNHFSFIFRLCNEEDGCAAQIFQQPSLAQMHNALVSALAETFSPETRRRIILIQILTLVWMSVEAVVSLGAAWMARSPALLGFGGDSAVELLSAAVVLWRFYSPSRGDHCGAASGQNRRRLAPCSRRVCCPRLCSDAARTRRTPAQSHRNRAAHPCRSGHALACEAKAATFSGHRQRSLEGRCR